MKTRLAYPLVAILSLSTWAGCGDDDPTVPSGPTDGLMPLQIGNSWSYWSFNVNPVTGDTSGVENISVAISGTERIGGTDYFQFDDGVTVAQNRSDGLFFSAYDSQGEQFFDDLFFKFPAESGETYGYNVVETPGALLRIKVTITNVTVPAGGFESYAYELIDRSSGGQVATFDSVVFYLTPGVGLVRTQNADQAGDNLLLLSFDVN